MNRVPKNSCEIAVRCMQPPTLPTHPHWWPWCEHVNTPGTIGPQWVWYHWGPCSQLAVDLTARPHTGQATSPLCLLSIYQFIMLNIKLAYQLLWCETTAEGYKIVTFIYLHLLEKHFSLHNHYIWKKMFENKTSPVFIHKFLTKLGGLVHRGRTQQGSWVVPVAHNRNSQDTYLVTLKIHRVLQPPGYTTGPCQQTLLWLIDPDFKYTWQIQCNWIWNESRQYSELVPYNFKFHIYILV